MPYLIIDKTLLEVVGTSENEPVLGDSNLLVKNVKSLEGYEVRVFAIYPTGELDDFGNSIISEKWFPGTSFTQAQVDAEVSRQENQKARLTQAVQTVITNVNGKAVTALTTTDVRNLLAVLMAQQGWISSTGTVQIPADLTLFR